MNFNQFDLSKQLLDAVSDLNFTSATLIQEKTIPLILKHQDVLAKSQTGSGKTIAYALPTVQHFLNNPSTYILVLAPTRELALQIDKVFNELLKYIPKAKTTLLYGGVNIQKQIVALKQNPKIVIATPGRLLDHVNRKTIALKHFNVVVLDEADEMLNMGFKDDVLTILEKTAPNKQTLLFSATISKDIYELAQSIQRDVIFIENKNNNKNITQQAYQVSLSHKYVLLQQLLAILNPTQAMIFCNTKKSVDEITLKLAHLNMSAAGIHGDMKQEMRTKVIQQFKAQKLKYLICSDVMARGIDIDNLEMVINYDLPQEIEFYIHRIGRCGRIDKKGTSITFFTPKESKKIRQLEKLTKQSITIMPLPNEKALQQGVATLILSDLMHSLSHTHFKKVREEIRVYLENNHLNALDVLTSYAISKNKVDGLQQPIQEEKLTRKRKSFVNLTLNIGKKANIHEKNIVDALKKTYDINTSAIGQINIYKPYSTVDIEKLQASKILSSKQNVMIKKQKVKIKRS